MPLDIPRLDDRTFEDLVQDAKAKIPRLCPQWTDLNDSDPGITLIHLMAYLGETILYRLNRVPERNYLKFLELMGVRLQPAMPARTWVVFELTPGANEAGLPTINPGTLITTKAEGGIAIEFQTCDALTVTTAKPIHVFSQVGEFIADHSEALFNEELKPVRVFEGQAVVPHSLYLGDTRFGPSMQKARLSLQLSFVQKLSTSFYLEWEIWDGEQWILFPPTQDDTRGFSQDGEIIFDALPVIEQEVDGVSATWLRARLTGAEGNQLPVIASLKRCIALEAEYGFRPEVAFVSIAEAPDQAVDFSKDCSPFGSAPKEGNIFAVKPGNKFYIASPLLGSEDANITLEVIIPEYYTILPDSLTGVQVQWEYYNDSGTWSVLKGMRDHTRLLTHSGAIRFERPKDMTEFSVRGESAFYLRAHLIAGTYGQGDTCRPPIISDIKISFTEHPRDWDYYKADNYYTYQSLDAPDPDKPIEPIVVEEDKGPIFCLALDKQPSNAAYRLYFDIERQSEMPPAQVKWEYKSQGLWQPVRLLKDDTQAFTQRGVLEFMAPADWQEDVAFGHAGYWLRARWTVVEFLQSPSLAGVYRNAVEVVQAVTRYDEVLDSGRDEPLQTVLFPEKPLLPGPSILVREVEDPSAEQIATWQTRFGDNLIKEMHEAPNEHVKALWVRWKEVETFFGSDKDDRHYLFDPIEGTIQFGDGRHGMRVPSGRSNIKAEYFHLGGGARGNVGKGVITVLEQPLPSIKSVSNIEAARGGADIEAIDAAKARGSWILKHRDRAVTQQDFEQLAKEASTEVALARCLDELSNRDEVQVLILPHGENEPEEQPRPTNRLIRIVTDHLNARRLINTKLKVFAPDYIDCEIQIDVVLMQSHVGQFPVIRSTIEQEVKHFSHPLKGGPDGDGWPMGRTVHISEMYYLLEQIEGVNYVDKIRMAKTGAAEWTEKIKLPPTAFPYFKDIHVVQL